MKTIICLFIGLLFTVNTCAQEIGAAPTKIWTDNKEIGNPTGFSIYLFQPVGRFGIRLEYVYAENTRNYYGFLNGGFLIAPEEQIQDSISSTSAFRAIELSFNLPRLFEVFQNYINIGAGITFDKFNREKSGLSSGKTFGENENKFGIFYSVSISRENILNTPIKLEILFKHKGLTGGTFATDVEQPFTGAMDVKELQFDVAYVF